MDKTVCMTYFSIRGEFDTSDVSKILGMENTGGHSIGQKKKYGLGTYNWAAWEFGTDYIETFQADEQAESVIEPLTGKINELLFIKEKYDCDFILMQVPIVENGETPALRFNRKIIEFCVKTGTEIEIDLYANPYARELEI